MRCAPSAVLFAAALLAPLLFASPLLAQRSGGSFGGGGGGHFGGGGGGRFGGGGGGSGGTFNDARYGSDSAYGRDNRSASGGDSIGLVLLLVTSVGVFLIAGNPARNRGTGVSEESADVSAIQIAIDHHARPLLQARLDALARSDASATQAGLTAALHEVCIALRRADSGWLFAFVANSHVESTSAILARFRALAADARSRFQIETVRAIDGVVHTRDDATLRDPGNAKGVVVVTVVVAARREILDVEQPADGASLHRLLQDFGAISASELMTLDVIWSPSSENDRMSEADLAREYPELRRIRDETIEGRVFCGNCSSPFRRPQKRCPHCGASAKDARTASPRD